jgi:hypothetical protein
MPVNRVFSCAAFLLGVGVLFSAADAAAQQLRFRAFFLEPTRILVDCRPNLELTLQIDGPAPPGTVVEFDLFEIVFPNPGDFNNFELEETTLAAIVEGPLVPFPAGETRLTVTVAPLARPSASTFIVPIARIGSQAVTTAIELEMPRLSTVGCPTN